MISDSCYDFLNSKNSDKLERDIRYYLSNIIFKECYRGDLRIRCVSVMRMCNGIKLDILTTEVKALLTALNMPHEKITEDL